MKDIFDGRKRKKERVFINIFNIFKINRKRNKRKVSGCLYFLIKKKFLMCNNLNLHNQVI